MMQLKKNCVFLIVVSVLLAFSFTKTYANPLNTAWYVTDSSNNTLNGAHLTIYWSTSTSGPFTAMASSVVEDKVAGAYQNPVITGYWNPSHPDGMAVVDLHITHVGNYYFYVKIEYNSLVWYWPTATSTKPGDSSWASVSASGSPSGYAATGDGLGNGPTTAFSTKGPPVHPPVVPEFGLGIETITGLGMLIAYAIKRKPKS